MIDYEGYVVYVKKGKKKKPFGVISQDAYCKAVSNNIPAKLKKMLIHIEDCRYYEHHGIDIHAILRATAANIKSRRIVQGGSTITQQLSRNLLNINDRSFYRKIKESIKAIKLERKYTKDEILDLYFNEVYFGENLKGIRAASLRYLGKDIDDLTNRDFIILLTLLRGPNFYLNNPKKLNKRYSMLNSIFLEKKDITRKCYRKNIINKHQISIQKNHLQIIRKEAIPYIVKIINEDNSIESTIDIRIQSIFDKLIKSSKDSVSAIAIRKGTVVAFGSTYGTDYPFTAKSNVGSTLKPFIYCFLKENGIRDEQFNSYSNNLNWEVREATSVPTQLSIDNALFYSNNNTFINACEKVGIDQCLLYLSILLNVAKDQLSPASILGATKCGLSLYDLASAYYRFFHSSTNIHKQECLQILQKNANFKLGIKGIFLKTGTTNDNKERYVVLGNADNVYAFLRNGKCDIDKDKEGRFLKFITVFARNIFNNKKGYQWT